MKNSHSPRAAVLARALLLAGALGAGPLRAVPAQAPRPSVERILLVEDRRARVAGDVDFLRGALASGDSVVLRTAVRAVGRLERPGLARLLVPLLADARPGLRGEAAQSIAQALQGLARDTIAARRDPAWPVALAALSARVGRETDPRARGMLALALGRLPYRERPELEEAERHIGRLLAGALLDPVATALAARGAETLGRRAGRRPVLGDSLGALLRRTLRRDGDAWTTARRRAFGALAIAGAAREDDVRAAFASADPELRRQAVLSLGAGGTEPLRSEVLGRAAQDAAIVVRREALRTRGRRPERAGCDAFIAALADTDVGTRLLAVDLLGSSCPDTGAALARLRPLAAGSLEGPEWRSAAHALVAIARLAAAEARGRFPEAAASTVWQSRMYAARGAAVARDTALLRTLAGDRHHNVREAAIAGLQALGGRVVEPFARAALAHPDYQLVLTAAGALAGVGRDSATSAALLASLERISAERRETSRDTRVGLLVRLRESGGRHLAARLLPRLRDFDPVVAESAAALLRDWTGRAARTAPRPPAPGAVRAGEIEALRGGRIILVMASGDTLDAELLVDAAPLTVAHVARLARRGYYDGLTFHRVVPNFVVQGGSPGANEYHGDGPFMRDELGPVSHERGTFGISTRGRDTGDAQLFINLVDNPRLDFDYTVWARTVRGGEALDRIAEGAVIRRVEVRAR
ncbi:MAG: peptidylprolyl isomerase [Gemmatimonadales bacterium]